MPPYLTPWLAKTLLVWQVIAMCLDLSFFFFAPDVAQPGRLSSAYGAAVVAIWLAMLGQYKRDSQLTILSIPYVVIFFLAIFGITSYLLSAAVSGAFIYLLLADLNAES